MDLVKSFIMYLSRLDLSKSPYDVSNDMYNELETLDVDLETKSVMKNKNLPHDVRIKIVNLIEFYYLIADECINEYSYKECYEFLRELKIKAKEVGVYIGLF